MKTKQESIFSSKTLTYFLQLAETMNYTQAAQILGITQPALTQQIKKLERTVGAPLFYSVGKKLRLSDAGYTMLEATHQIYGILNQSTSATQGEINIGLLASVEDAVFEDFAIGLYQSNPDLKISFHMLTRKEIWERLENNKIDLAIMYLPDDSIKNWKPYESKKIISDDLLFIHHDEQLSKKRRIKFKDTTSQPWAMYPEGYYLDQTLHEAYKNQLADFPQGVANFTTPNQLLHFSMETQVSTALPNSFMIGQDNLPNTWTAHFEPNIRFDLAFVFRKGKAEIPRISLFLAQFDRYLHTDDYISRLKQLRNQLN
ncbi:LysR family transcriptional regulator [Levilactobacillus brevis]|uniref:LysR family transcriptional regulator n=1 Tax=Levilactobacillus brevis TaxID=1580 RepID=UPI001CFFC117|nr:LysR family transcriptional regulator [Levilactobacillus brevis]MCB5232766.1 LysR family transcriptional regulator [Levilactobacillus brevis]